MNALCCTCIIHSPCGSQLGVLTFDTVRSDPELENQLEAADLAMLSLFTLEITLQLIYLVSSCQNCDIRSISIEPSHMLLIFLGPLPLV
jgi:hypothetical protein